MLITLISTNIWPNDCDAVAMNDDNTDDGDGSSHDDDNADCDSRSHDDDHDGSSRDDDNVNDDLVMMLSQKYNLS